MIRVNKFPVVLRMWPILGVLCVAFILSGCATTEDVGRLRWELNSLKADMNSVRKTSQNLETKLPGQTKQIDAKLKEIEDHQDTTDKTLSDLLIQIQDLTREFQKLTGQFDESRYFSEKSASEMAEHNKELEARIKELEVLTAGLDKKLAEFEARRIAEENARKQAEEAEKAKKKVEEAKKKASAAAASSGNGAKDLYMSAYHAYKEGKDEAAREKFMKVLNDYKENEYSDNARFWIAESYYKESKYKDAILAYEELFQKNPNSDKVPGAMLKQGLAFHALKDKKTGDIILEKLIEKFPKSEQAKLAAKKLKRTVPPKKNK
jgi:tol-pal system protein YbgF